MKPGEKLNKAVLFLTFNRLDTTQKVFEQIKIAQPPRLYLACDGARKNKENEAATVESVRKWILDNINWDCEVKTLFRDENLGCGKAVSSGITWFFEQEADGIILEDDCVPSQSFFRFCEEMLDKYKDDEWIMHIGGSGLDGLDVCKPEDDQDATYFLSRYNYIWGWASWARAWKHYDYEFKNFDSFIKGKKIEQIIEDKDERAFWLRQFELTKRKIIDTWDYQLYFSIWNQGGYAILPYNNLVTNIGLGHEKSTHTTDDPNNLANRKIYDLNTINHPIDLRRNVKADKFACNVLFIKPESLFRKIKNKVFKKNKRKLLKQNKLDAIYLSLIRNIDGPYGNRLRRKYYKKRLNYLGLNVTIDTGVFIEGAQYISINDGAHIDKGCLLVASPPNIDISHRAVKENKNDGANVISGAISIGKNCHICQNTMIFGYGGVRIGNNTVMSAGSKVYSLTSLPNNPHDKSQICSIVPYDGISPSEIGPVELDDNVWLGLDVFVFPGVKIGKNSFVRTNSIVLASFEENSYLAGDPAIYIKQRFEVRK